jgi:hypothetical protein
MEVWNMQEDGLGWLDWESTLISGVYKKGQGMDGRSRTRGF